MGWLACLFLGHRYRKVKLTAMDRWECQCCRCGKDWWKTHRRKFDRVATVESPAGMNY
jgi:hypothetical protein